MVEYKEGHNKKEFGMKKFTEAMLVLERAGLLVEEYPGKGYNKPIKQMIDEISKAGKLSELRDRLINAVSGDLMRVLPMHMSGIHSDTWSANTINLGPGPSNQREAKEKAREIFDNARNETGIPVYLRKYRPVGKNGYGDWLAYFNVFSDDYGHTKTDEMARLLSNNDEYWEILDDIYTKRTNKTVKHEPSEEEVSVIRAKNNNTLAALNKISRTPMTKKDWERFNGSTIGRQIATLDNLSEEKLPSRKHAILLMMAKKYKGTWSDEIDFGNEDVNTYKVRRFLRGCGINIPNAASERDLTSSVREALLNVKDYFQDELEVLEQ